jgi:hypothetical protein
MPPQAFSAPMLQPQHATCENPPPSLIWPHADLAVGDPARYLEQGQQGHPAAMQQQQEQQYRNAALPPRQPAENEEAMWRSAAHHAPAAAVHPEAAAAGASSPSRALYEGQDQMIQQLAARREWRRWQCRGCADGPWGRRGERVVGWVRVRAGRVGAHVHRIVRLSAEASNRERRTFLFIFPSITVHISSLFPSVLYPYFMYHIMCVRYDRQWWVSLESLQ